MAQSATGKKSMNVASAKTFYIYGIRETKNADYLSLVLISGKDDAREFISVPINKNKTKFKPIYDTQGNTIAIAVAFKYLAPFEKHETADKADKNVELPF